MSYILISAAHKSSGKTTICIGLCAELRRRGVRVQPFKKGPDYIDPMWLTQSAGCACYNLDFYTQSRNELRREFVTRMRNADIGLIEGNKGLYDGLDLDGSNSNAALATLLGAPVVLVIDVQGITRGIAPLLLGYQEFGPELNIAGVILNKVGGMRHENKLRQVIEYYTDIPVIGAIHRIDRPALVERHLGLIPSNEAAEPNKQIEAIRSLIAKQVDMNLLQQIAISTTQPLTTTRQQISTDTSKTDSPPTVPVRIGIARDAAFGFYYPGDLDALERQGAKLVFFSPLQDQSLPDIDGLFIGGGFPEVFMHALEENIPMRQAMAKYVEAGRPLYAECGGLMYLTRSISWRDQSCAMVGVIAADAVMCNQPQGKGYVRLRPTTAYPWKQSGTSSDSIEIAAHEFHYSRLENLAPNQTYAFEVIRGSGIDGSHDGIVYKNLLASFTHLRDVAGYSWTKHFLDHIKSCIGRI